MAIVDAVKLLGVFRPGMSFSLAVSATLHSLINGAIASGSLRDRSGFEYSALMQDFDMKQSGRKLAISNELIRNMDEQTQREQESKETIEAFQPPQKAVNGKKVFTSSISANHQHKQFMALKSKIDSGEGLLEEKERMQYINLNQYNWEDYKVFIIPPSDERYKELITKAQTSVDMSALELDEISAWQIANA